MSRGVLENVVRKIEPDARPPETKRNTRSLICKSLKVFNEMTGIMKTREFACILREIRIESTWKFNSFRGNFVCT